MSDFNASVLNGREIQSKSNGAKFLAERFDSYVMCGWFETATKLQAMYCDVQ